MAANTVTPAPAIMRGSDSILPAPPLDVGDDSGGPSLGRVLTAMRTATTPMARMSTNTLLHPSTWDIAVPSGTPTTDDMLNPEKIHDTALALNLGVTRSITNVIPTASSDPEEAAVTTLDRARDQ